MSEKRGFDVVVVGGGVIGLSCAWRLAQRGARVAVAERGDPGGGATRVAAGMLAPVGELTFGEPELLELTLAAARLYPEFVAEVEAAGVRTVAGGNAGGRSDVQGLSNRPLEEEVLAETIILATGAWSAATPWLPEHARPPVRPVKGQVLELRRRDGEPPAHHILASERVYLVPRGDGRLIVGATVEEMGFDTAVTAGGVHELLRESYRLLPDVAEMELVDAVAGLRPGTPDNLPLVGPGEIDGLVLATGHFRNGILLAPLAAETVADLLGAAPAEVGR